MNVYTKVVPVLYMLFFNIGAVYAYELGTHARLSEQAYNRSILNADTVFLGTLGLVGLDLFNPLGKIYYDISGSSQDSRDAELFSIEKNRMPDADIEKFTFKGRLMRGAIREDDIPDYWPFLGKNPQDDPDGKVARVKNHFYDPVIASHLRSRVLHKPGYFDSKKSEKGVQYLKPFRAVYAHEIQVCMFRGRV